MNDFIFRNTEINLGIILPSDIHLQLLAFCESSYPLETGGVIIGNYSLDYKWANVTRVLGPQRYSRHNRSSFFRSNHNIKSILDKEWALGNYYLGEWHYHPDSTPAPSHVDINQMKVFAKNKQLNCSEPVLLIIGGSMDHWSISASIFYGRIFPLYISSDTQKNLSPDIDIL